MDTARPQDPAQLLTELTERVPEVLHALVVSADGVPVAASCQMQPADLERLAAITAGLISLASGAARIFDSGDLAQALVVMERGALVIMAIDEGANLSVLTTSAADLELIAYEMTMLVERAASVLSAPARGTVPGPGIEPER